MSIPNGVTQNTLQNIEFEAGLILKEKFTSMAAFNKETSVLCATSGGIKVAIAPVVKKIQFDGVMDNTAGLDRIVGWTGSVQFSTKEVDAEKVKIALGYAGITDTESGKKVTPLQGVKPVTDYQDFYVLGKLGDGTWRQIVVNKAMNIGGLTETRDDKNEVVIAFDLQANYAVDTQDTPPVDIEYLNA